MAKTPYHVQLPLGTPLAGETLSRWLYRGLRAAILEGRLKPGVRLPSTRGLAAQHGIARGTVGGVFEQLLAEGYLVSSTGSGTFVNRKLPDDFFSSRPADGTPAPPAVRGRISERGKKMAASPFPDAPQDRGLRAFKANEPSVDAFPTAIWSRLAARRIRLATRHMLRTGDPMGYFPLREAVAAHLGSTRGVLCTPEQIMIVSGTQQALDLVARLVLDPGDEVWLEDPGYPGALAAFRAAGAEPVPVPVDERGLRVADGLKRAPRARLAYVTPAHQYPLCVTMALERRLELLKWSRSTGAWIFEDDYDSEFRFSGRPLAAMQGMAPGGNVIFSGSFSKMLFPSLRMGFLVVPPHLTGPLCAARSVLDRYCPVPDQAVLNDFITGGHFGHHLRRMREIYAEHLDILIRAAETEWGDRLVVHRTDSGLQTVGWLAKGLVDTDTARAAAELGVEVIPLSSCATRWRGKNGLQIGFAAVRPAELRRGVTTLARLL